MNKKLIFVITLIIAAVISLNSIAYAEEDHPFHLIRPYTVTDIYQNELDETTMETESGIVHNINNYLGQ